MNNNRIQWNEVTWYSKLGAIILFILVVPALTFYIGTEYEKTMSVTHSLSIPVSYQPASSVPSLPVTAPTKSISPSTSAHQQGTVTMADNNSTLHYNVGDSFLLKLGDYVWDISMSNPSIISRIKNVAVIRGAQGIYAVNNAGQTDLTAVGRPMCNQGEMCSHLEILFKVKIVVSK